MAAAASHKVREVFRAGAQCPNGELMTCQCAIRVMKDMSRGTRTVEDRSEPIGKLSSIAHMVGLLRRVAFVNIG